MLGKLFDSFGNRDHPPLLFLHGFMGSRQDWSEIIRSLQDHYFCITVDLAGHGQHTNLKTPAAYGFEAGIETIAQILHHLQQERVTLVGYSMGGRLALEYTRQHPETVAKLILESALPGLEDDRQRAARRQQDQLLADRLQAMQDLESFLNEWYHLPLFGSIQNHPGYPDLIQRRLQNDPAELAQSVIRMSPADQENLWPFLETLSVPLLYIAGSRDAKYGQIAHRIEKLKIGLVRTIQNCGHVVHFEKPDLFIETLLTFLDKKSGG